MSSQRKKEYFWSIKSLIGQITKEHKNRDNESDVHINTYFIPQVNPTKKSTLALPQNWKKATVHVRWEMLVLEATVSHSVSILIGSVGITQPGHFMSTGKNPWQQLCMSFTRNSPHFAKMKLFPWSRTKGALDAYTTQTSSREGFSTSDPRDTLLHFPRWLYCEDVKRWQGTEDMPFLQAPMYRGVLEQGVMGCFPLCTLLPVEIRSVPPSSYSY